MNEKQMAELKDMLISLEADTETYVDHDRMVTEYEKYLLIIAIRKFLERYN